MREAGLEETVGAGPGRRQGPLARRRDTRTNRQIGVGNGTGTSPRSMDPRTGRLMKGRILSVDDETKVLQGPRRMLMRMRNERKYGL